MKAVGADGCRRGWAVAWIDTIGERGFGVMPSIGDVLGFQADMTMIDMPIGLPDSGPRGCDRAARAMLRPHGSRVFIDVRRPLLAFRHDYAAANRWAKSDGRGISRQLYGILPKIAEVDVAMSPERQATAREAHPELVFLRLNNDTPLPSKKTDAGRQRRIELAKKAGFAAIEEWLPALRGSGAKPDDLLDACACADAALSALRGEGRRIEGAAERDAKGLRMEIWY